MNSLETPAHRELCRDASLGAMLEKGTVATALIIKAAGSDINVIYNVTYQHTALIVMWLQEHGVTIPADVCHELGVEVR